MKNAMEIMLERRSVKKYLPDMPRREDIDKVIEAGLAAASGRNLQASVIIAVTNKEIRDKLSKANADVMGAKADPFYGAPCVLVVLGNKKAHTYVYDGSLTLGNMMLAAQSLGLGSICMMGPLGIFSKPEGAPFLKSLNLSEGYQLLLCVGVGYANEHPEASPRNREVIKYVE
jgi:nitroreductase